MLSIKQHQNEYRKSSCSSRSTDLDSSFEYETRRVADKLKT